MSPQHLALLALTPRGPVRGSLIHIQRAWLHAEMKPGLRVGEYVELVLDGDPAAVLGARVRGIDPDDTRLLLARRTPEAGRALARWARRAGLTSTDELELLTLTAWEREPVVPTSRPRSVSEALRRSIARRPRER